MPIIVVDVVVDVVVVVLVYICLARYNEIVGLVVDVCRLQSKREKRSLACCMVRVRLKYVPLSLIRENVSTAGQLL